jgi:thiamine kinase
MDLTMALTLTPEDLPQALQRGLKEIQPILGGLTNRSWKLVREQQDCIWRRHSPLLVNLGISRALEHRVLTFLAPHRFAPNIVHYSSLGIANQWIEGQPLLVSPSQSQMVKVMAQYHRLPLCADEALPLFNYRDNIQTYWKALLPENRFDQLSQLYHHAQRAEDALFNQAAPCLLHCDLGYYNLIDTGEQLAIIDWEYACIGDPLIDVVLTAMACRYRLDTFVETYCREMGGDIDSSVARAYEIRFYFEIMSALWFVVCYQYNNDQSYLNEAMEMASALCNSDHCFSL